MAVCTLEDKHTYNAVFYCSTSGWAFGPLMPSAEVAEAFLAYLEPTDPRTLTDRDLESRYLDFVRENVCECDTVRETSCSGCKFDGEAVDGQHYDGDGPSGKCYVEPKPAAGERFVCEYCRRERTVRSERVR
jgi:hypothetical protein